MKRVLTKTHIGNKAPDSRCCLWSAFVMLALTAGNNSLAAAGGVEATFAPEMSEEAVSYWEKAKVGNIPDADFSDPELLGRLRNMLGQLFLSQAKELDPELEPLAVDMNGVNGYWLGTKNQPDSGRTIIYLHGGGYIIGSAKTNLLLPLLISSAAQTPVLSVEYRLAPEHPYPAALDDALAAYLWLLEQHRSADDIAIIGDSAGGGLALSLVLALIDQGAAVPRIGGRAVTVG